jgi:plastocyanin
MRGTAALALVLASALALAACSAPAAPTPPLTPAPPAPPASTSTAGTPVASASSECRATTEAGGTEVVIEGFAFDPDPVRAGVGQPITWTNRDGAPHTATLDAMSCTTDGLGKGQSGGLVFSRAGTYGYHCRIHPDAMRGTIEISG